MGFSEVYKALMEIFPEVDLRALRAVALEHNKDVDAAVEAVLTEIVPCLAEMSKPPTSSLGNNIVPFLAEMSKPPTSSFGNNPPSADPSGFTLNIDGVLVETSDSEEEEQNASLLNDANGGDFDNDHVEVHGGFAGEAAVPSENSPDVNHVCASTQPSDLAKGFVHAHIFPDTSVGEFHESIDCEKVMADKNDESQGNLSAQDKLVSPESSGGFDGEAAVTSENCSDKNHLCASTHSSDLAEGFVHAHVSPDTSAGEFHKSLDRETVMADKKDGNQGNLSAQDKLVSPESSGESVVADMISTESKYLDPICSLNTDSNKATISDIDINDDSSLNTMVSRSNEICRAELLEGLISDARDNKKTLFSAMESVISLMRKVELQEEATQQAKEASSNGGLAILNTVDELIKILQHAKEANDMRAGEVYGERAVLATEARELQARLFSLSEERDKALAILDEMHEDLLSRLAAAEEEEKAADMEKLEKEEMARRSLAEQELTMEKVVQESNTLKQLAEENAKLQELLEDRSHVMDSLQEEISIICQDVRALREKFDDHVPLSKSLSSPQSSCKSVSSFSSSKSVSSDQVDEVPDQSYSSENLQKSELTTTNEPVLSTWQPDGNDKKALAEEGWEFFENDDDYM